MTLARSEETTPVPNGRSVQPNNSARLFNRHGGNEETDGDEEERDVPDDEDHAYIVV